MSTLLQANVLPDDSNPTDPSKADDETLPTDDIHAILRKLRLDEGKYYTS